MSVACVLIPHFMARIEYQRQPALSGRPVLVVTTQGSRSTILDHSQEAAGVYPGMTLSEALAQLKDAAILEADLPAYQEAFENILNMLEHISPVVELAEPGCVYMELRGLEGLYGGHGTLLKCLLDSLPCWLEPQIGVASGKFPAYVAALHANSGEVAEVADDVRGFLSGMKIEILPVSIEMKMRLARFGLQAISQVASLPVGPLQAQFGIEGRQAWELANGIDHRPVLPRKQEEIVQESASFPSPTCNLATILTTIDALVGKAFSRPQLRRHYSRMVIVQGQMFQGGTWGKRIAFKEPAGDRYRAFVAIKSQLAQAKFSGPLEDIRLTFSGFTGESGRQESFFAEVRKWEQLREAVRQLEARLGRKPPIYFVRDVEPWSRLPERRQALVSFDP